MFVASGLRPHAHRGQWIDSKEDVPDDPTWVGIGYIIADIGLIVLLVLTVIGWWRDASERRGRHTHTVVTVVTLLLLAAYIVAIWAMTTKPT